MTDIRTIINNARAAGYEVALEDDNFTMYEKCFGGWYVVGEWGWEHGEQGWEYDEHEVDDMTVIYHEADPADGRYYITVVDLGW